MTTLDELGEFPFIERIRKLLPSDAAVEVGVGDDCAVFKSGDRRIMVSCDMSVENVHFTLDAATPEQIGWKVAAASLSDIAAMGGTPLFLLISLSAPGETSVQMLEELYKGLADAAGHCGATIIGGDTTRSPSGLVINVTVVGQAQHERYLTRAGAVSGDVLIVTGNPGHSAAGLDAQLKGHAAPVLREAHYHPIPRIAEGQWLCKRDDVHALIDTSDGLLADAGHIADASGLGLAVTSASIAIDPELATYCADTRQNLQDFALRGGEDYELAFAAHPDSCGDLISAFRGAFTLNASIVGLFTDEFSGVMLDGERPVGSGFDHFG